ncbi:MAG: putative toxin-antitoxin system toxin component, PIN family [Chloroflexia bacterium]|nr:putative toxin-antitoxin system toxin component, PIN family [Chloroflexia bacterium]
MVKVVFDTVVFVRALLNRRSHWSRLVFDRGAAYRLLVSAETLQEALEVLRHPELVRRFSRLPGRDAGALIEVLRQADMVDIDLSSFPRVCRDLKDDKFLATAEVAVAGYLVSEDQDLLVLREFEGTAIVDAETFLGVLDQHGERGDAANANA